MVGHLRGQYQYHIVDDCVLEKINIYSSKINTGYLKLCTTISNHHSWQSLLVLMKTVYGFNRKIIIVRV